MLKGLTIGALARRGGVGVETIRFYERRGLICRPPRPGAGFRNYPEETLARIRFIRQARALGFTLREIAELLDLRVAPGADCAAVRKRAATRLADVEARLGDLERIRRALAKLIAACPGRGELATCTILGALAEQPEALVETAAGRRRGTRRKAMKSLELGIEGMHCEGCAATIEALLAREPGVKAASVSYAARKGRIVYDPGTTDPGRLAAAIERAGYRVFESGGAP